MNKETNKAFVFIGCGPYARTYKCELAIESLIKVAKWRGKVYLISDSPECFDIDKLRKDSGTEDIKLIGVSKFSDRWDSPIALCRDFPFIKTIPARTVIQSKILKASLFEIIKDEEVEVILYCDSDVIFTREDLTTEVTQLASEWEDRAGIKLRIKDHKWQPSNDDPHWLHTGFMIAHRTYSKEILEEWKKRMKTPSEWLKDPYDRTKFFSAFQSVEDGESKFYPIPDSVEKVYNFIHEPAFAAHITIARILKIGFKKVEEFINQFDLKSGAKGYYSLPGMSKLRRYVFYLGYIPYRKNYKIEDWWRNRSKR